MLKHLHNLIWKLPKLHFIYNNYSLHEQLQLFYVKYHANKADEDLRALIRLVVTNMHIGMGIIHLFRAMDNLLVFFLFAFAKITSLKNCNAWLCMYQIRFQSVCQKYASPAGNRTTVSRLGDFPLHICTSVEFEISICFIVKFFYLM